MNQIVPPTLLFDFRVRIPACPPPSARKKGPLLTLSDDAQLPEFCAIDGIARFANVSVGWNTQGVGVVASVSGRSGPLTGSAKTIESSDCLELWIDTRPTGNVHRATGYCHRLACFPADDDADGEPSVVAMPIAQQREIRSEIQEQQIRRRVTVTKDGYKFELWIPGSQLYGYRQMDELRQLGFYSVVRDTQLGEQPLTIDDEFPFAWDPSLWVQLELIDS